MKSSEPLSKNEREFVLHALEEKRRIDGRGIYDMRTLKIEFGDRNGEATVLLGNTRVLAIVSSEIVAPYEDRPSEGFFTFNVHLTALGDSKWEGGRTSEGGIELGRVVERGMRESKAIDTESLCIVAGSKVWSIKCDLHILDNNGNLFDASSIAAIAALLHFRRPATTISGNRLTVHSVEDREPVPLSIHHIPICISFAFFEEGRLSVVDPVLKEEEIMQGRMSITVNSQGEICAVQKAGGTPLAVDQILQCSSIAALKAQEITQLLHTALAAHQANKKRSRVNTDSIHSLQKAPKVTAPLLKPSSASASDAEVLTHCTEVKLDTRDFIQYDINTFNDKEAAESAEDGAAIEADSMDYSKDDDSTSKTKDGTSTTSAASEKSKEKPTAVSKAKTSTVPKENDFTAALKVQQKKKKKKKENT